MEKESLSLDGKISYSDLTKKGKNALHLLRDYSSIIIKEADKRSAVVVWDWEDYLGEAFNQLSDKDVYRKIKGDAEGPLVKVIKRFLRKIRNRDDNSDSICFQRFTNNIMFPIDQ